MRGRNQTHDTDACDRGLLAKSLTCPPYDCSCDRESTAATTYDPSFSFRKADDAREEKKQTVPPPQPSTSMAETFASTPKSSFAEISDEKTTMMMIMFSSRKMLRLSVERM